MFVDSGDFTFYSASWVALEPSLQALGWMDEIFAHNVIQHIMSGKAYARALCGHLLIYAALQKLIFDDMVNQDQISPEELDIVANSKESDYSDEI